MVYHQKNMICMIKYRTKQRYSSLNAQCTTMNTIMLTNKSFKKKRMMALFHVLLVIIQLSNIKTMD